MKIKIRQNSRLYENTLQINYHIGQYRNMNANNNITL